MEETSIRKKLASIKKELKCWESMYMRGHGRKPTKHDILLSGHEVKDAYKEYSILKQKLFEVTTPSTAPDNKINDPGSKQNQDGIFGSQLNKKENTMQYTTRHHIKDHILRDRHKLPFVKKRHLKTVGVNNTKSIGNDKITIVPANVMKIDDNEAIHQQGGKTPQAVEFITSDEIHQSIDITANIGNEIRYSRKASSVKWRQKSKKLSFNVSKDWLEKVRPITETEDDSTLMPFVTVEDEEEENDDSSRKKAVEDKIIAFNAATVKRGKSARASVEETEINVVHRDDSSSLIPNNFEISIGNIQAKAESCDRVSSSSKATKDLPLEYTNAPSLEAVPLEHCLYMTNETKEIALCHSILQNEGELKSQIDNCELIDRGQRGSGGDKSDGDKSIKVLNQCDKNGIDVKVKRTSQRKRKQFGNESGENDLEESVGKDGLNEVCKRMKADNHLNAGIKVRKGARLVSENFVAIDIQKKKYSHGKRRVKGSAYKRLQWKKKSQFSKLGATNCYRCKRSGHWAKECQEFPSRNPSVEDKREGFNQTCQSEDDSGCSTFSFYDIPDLERSWPRIPYSTKSSSLPVAPLFSPVNGEPCKDAIEEVHKALKTLGYSSFREGQENAVARIVSGLSTLLVLPTGSGKSLCYQLPAFLYYKRAKYLTLVISPLVALMEDQVGRLPHGLKGACLHTNMTKKQREKVIQDVSNSKIAILLLSPESLLSGSSSTGFLPMLKNLPPIAFVCIDEAHCISEWSHNFRPSYLRVCKALRDSFGICCFLGLTATATKSTSLSVTKHLGIDVSQAKPAIIKGSTMPDNLHITVSKDDDRDRALVSLLTSQKFSKCTSIIIYCTRRDETERLAAVLRTCLKGLPPTELCHVDREDQLSISKKEDKGKRKSKSQLRIYNWDADSYHAGMTPAQRKKVQVRFMTGELRIVVATSAFGMGLDKSDVRAIVHYNMPKSFESFLQEIGRAGRDGLPAYCHVFLDEMALDLCELRRHVHGNSVDAKTIKKLVNSVFRRCDCKERAQSSKICSTNGEDGLLKDQGVVLSKELTIKGFDPNLKEGEKLQILSDLESMLEDEEQTEFGSDHVSQNNSIAGLDYPLRTISSSNDHFNCEKQFDALTENVLDHRSLETVPIRTTRFCTGHHVTLSIQETVSALDMREENIATLLSYLEHLTDSAVTLLGSVQSCCTVQCYGGPKQMKMLAKGFLPMTAVFNRMKRENRQHLSNRSITFNVVEIADDMSWDLDPIYREIRSLQWNTAFALSTNDSMIGKSGINVEFDNLSFHVIAPGDMTDDERDHICSALYETVKRHEKSRLMQLDALYNIFDQSSKKTLLCGSDDDVYEEDQQLRKIVEEYFNCDESEMNSFLERLARDKIELSVPAHKWDAISRDVRTIVNVHHDIIFNGRELARIFHGIDSPCFPAIVWGRDRRFWRRHLDIEFNELCKFITAEILRYRT